MKGGVRLFTYSRRSEISGEEGNGGIDGRQIVVHPMDRMTERLTD